nr:CDP-glycerol glycerophosphotransferase family protein [Butyrivibrio sp.]
YWIFSNLFGILQIFFLNWIIDPRKYVDYERLETSRKALAELENLDKKKEISKEDRRREKADYKRFFGIGNKHLVFYSESNGFYKYFKGVIEYILENTNIVIHYITSDPNDNIFKMAETNPQIKAYFIGEKKLITLMMKMDADVVVMTTPDLENYHIKRSYIRKDIEYIYIQHHVGSINMILRKGAVDNFDTVLVSGKYQKNEIRKTEEVYGLEAKNLVEYGYPLLDEMIAEYEHKTHIDDNNQKMILIAPSWHSQGIMFTCIDELLDGLKNSPYKVILRPHPQFVRHNRQNLEVLSNKYKDYENVDIQFDFTSNNPVLEADIVITDWSAIAYEYSFTTLKPVLYIDVPMKVNNPSYKEVDVEPIDIWIRDKTGARIDPEDAGKALDVIESLWASGDKYRDDILRIRSENIYNLGHSAEVAADYIIGVIKDKASSRKAEKEGKKINKSA